MHNILQNITITHNERDGTKLAIYTLTLRRLLVLMMTYIAIIAISRSERHQRCIRTGGLDGGCAQISFTLLSDRPCNVKITPD